jgi:demethylmenaquinone methyltransferase/2-methoxy-6-polyprenyl-1,4-benzoquinol methylase
MTYETGTLEPETVRGMFDRIAPVYDVMNRVMTAASTALAQARGRRRSCGREIACSTRAADRRLAVEAERRGGRVVALDFSRRCSSGARRSRARSSGCRGRARAALRTAIRRCARSASACGTSRSRGGPAELARVLRPGGKLAVSRSRGRTASWPFFRLWFDVLVPLAAACSRAVRRTRTSRRASGASPARRPLRALRERRLRGRPLSPPRRWDRGAARGQ